MGVFLSYSRSDQDRIADLIADLEQFGQSVWRDQKLSGGIEWWDQILEQIRRAEIFILAVSHSSLTSEACTSETVYAAGVNRQIIPVRFEDVPITTAPASIAATLSSTQWVDYGSGTKDETVALLRALSEGASSDLPAVLPAPPKVPGSYITDLMVRVEAVEELSVPDQFTMFQDLRQLGEAERDRSAAIDLMARFRGRDDLRTRVSDQVDEVLRTWRSGGDSVRSGDADPDELNDPAASEPSGSAAHEDRDDPDTESSDETEVAEWTASLNSEGRLERAFELSRGKKPVTLRFSRDLFSNGVWLDDERVVNDWRMASSSPWTYTFKVKDTKRREGTIEIGLREGTTDKISYCAVTIAGRTVYEEGSRDG